MAGKMGVIENRGAKRVAINGGSLVKRGRICDLLPVLLLLFMLAPVHAKDFMIENTTSQLLIVNGTSGYVGIGTSTPLSALHVNSSLGMGVLRVENASAPLLFINGSSGNIGINTTTPTHLLHVAGDANFTGAADHAGNVTVYNANVVLRNVNPSANASQERWVDTNGLVVAIEYWNGTAFVTNITM